MIYPGRILTIEYERVLADQELQTRKLLDFCGLEFEDSCLEFHKTDRTIRTASAWQVRQPLYGSAIGRWQNYDAHLAELIAALSDG